MRSRTRVVPSRLLGRGLLLSILGAVSLALPGVARAQMGAGMPGARIELAHVPAAARTAYFDGVSELENIFTVRGIARLDEALRLDETFGLARVFRAAQAAGLTMEERTAELDRGVVDAAKGSAAEATLAMAIRAQRLNRPDEARSLFQAARTLAPGDPHVAYFATLAANNGATPAEQIIALRRLTEEFPDLAPAHNILAYTLYRAGDHAGGLEEARTYAELAPDHPNAKDSYAEILQWEGRFDDAARLYREAATLDPGYAAAYTGIAEVRRLQGRVSEERAALTEGIGMATTPAARATLHRLIALSFALDGNRKEAEAALGTALTGATEAGLGVSNIHRDFALVNAMTGNGKGVAPHLQATTNPTATLRVVDALILAAGGMNDEARAKLAEIVPADADDPFVASNAPIARSLLLVNEGDADAALSEIARGDVTLPLAQAVSALAEQRRKNTTTARLLRDRVLSDPTFVTTNRLATLAHALAARVK